MKFQSFFYLQRYYQYEEWEKFRKMSFQCPHLFLQMHFEDLVFETIIHRNTRLAEAPSFGQSAVMYDADSKGSINYLNLAKEILQKNNLTKIKEADRILE